MAKISVSFVANMKKWTFSTLEKVYDFKYGQFNTNPDNGGKYPIYGANGIIGGYTEYNAQNSVVIGHMGENAGSVLWENGKHFVTYNGTIATPKINQDFDAKFGYYWLVNLNIRKICAGSGQPFLSYDDLNCLPISYPSFSEQKKIAAVLSALDDKIALNKKMNQKLEAMAKRLYDYWFVQFNFPDENGRSYKTSGGPMTHNETLNREIPTGWEVKSLFDCSDVLYGFPYATEPFDEENLDASTKPYPIIRIRDIKDNTISAKTTETVDDKYRTKVNDLLIGMDGYFHMSFWPRNDDYVNQRIVRIRQKQLSALIIYHQIAPFIKFKEDQAKGSTVGHLSDKDMKQINILVPKNPQLSEKFDSVLNLITKNKQEISRLTTLRDKLLPLLMNGQVEIC